METVDGIKIKRINCIAEPLRNPIAPKFLFLQEEFEGYDIVNLHSIYSFSSFSATISRKKCKTPIILTHHGKLKYGEPWKDTCVALYERSIAKKILQRVDHGIVLSSSDADFLSNLGLKRDTISEIPNGIDISEFLPFEQIDPFPFIHHHGLDGKFVIVYVGEITFRKGLQFLIQSLPAIIRGKPEQKFVLVIVGGGPDYGILVDLVKKLNLDNYVVFTGRLPFPELMQAYKAASVFVLPSVSEGMPTVIIEAMFFGVPIIATDIPSVREHFKDIALLVPPEDTKKLTDALIQHMEQQDLYSEFPNALKQRVMNHYTWDSVVGQYEEVYKKML
jgi:glycosyltransferase involved in cell wall biosynthesis